jgi:hypothetical protein
MPYYDALGYRIPDVYDDGHGVSGLDRYRLALAHMAAHKQWTTPIIADNYSPFQRMAVETLEDSRVEYLMLSQYAGLRDQLLRLHPKPKENACDPKTESCLRHRLTLLSRAILDSNHGYQNPDIVEFCAKFQALMQTSNSNTQEITQLALSFVARTRLQSDQLPHVHFMDTRIDYRDDNRHMWVFIEEGDEEEAFDEGKNKKNQQDKQVDGLPPHHYPEWDYHSKMYKPDWVSLYESLHPSGNSDDIDRLLEKHQATAKKLKYILDKLKPQQYVRVRYQEEGSELDLDVAIRALIDYKSGAQPDSRINMSHRHDGRDIAVLLLLDLSQSIDSIPDGCQQSILQLSQEAVALLSWAIEVLGDKFAIAGFSSNTRHEVRYQHIKGFSEHWDDTVKARLAALKAGYSTRMGAALRHAGHYLAHQQADKRLLLVLTDGEPSDIDVEDELMLIKDSHKAIQELDENGVYTYCINLDPQADDYVTDIFGKHYSVIDHIDKLPEHLPRLFAALTQ